MITIVLHFSVIFKKSFLSLYLFWPSLLSDFCRFLEMTVAQKIITSLTEPLDFFFHTDSPVLFFSFRLIPSPVAHKTKIPLPPFWCDIPICCCLHQLFLCFALSFSMTYKIQNTVLPLSSSFDDQNDSFIFKHLYAISSKCSSEILVGLKSSRDLTQLTLTLTTPHLICF